MAVSAAADRTHPRVDLIDPAASAKLLFQQQDRRSLDAS